MFRALCVFALLISSIALYAKPPGREVDKPQAEPKKPAPQMKLDGVTNWGDFTQAGPKQFTLDNHPIWSGVGTIRDDGRVFILWTLRTTEEACPGIYRIDPDGGGLSGVWGYGHDTRIDEDGELTGNTRADRVYNLPPPEPEI